MELRKIHLNWFGLQGYGIHSPSIWVNRAYIKPWQWREVYKYTILEITIATFLSSTKGNILLLFRKTEGTGNNDYPSTTCYLITHIQLISNVYLNSSFKYSYFFHWGSNLSLLTSSMEAITYQTRGKLSNKTPPLWSNCQLEYTAGPSSVVKASVYLQFYTPSNWVISEACVYWANLQRTLLQCRMRHLGVEAFNRTIQLFASLSRACPLSLSVALSRSIKLNSIQKGIIGMRNKR